MPYIIGCYLACLKKTDIPTTKRNTWAVPENNMDSEYDSQEPVFVSVEDKVNAMRGYKAYVFPQD